MPEDENNPPFSLNAKRVIVGAVRKILAQPQPGGNYVRPAKPRDQYTPRGFWAKIGAPNYTYMLGTHVLTYSWEEWTEDANGGWQTLSGGRSGTGGTASAAYNTVTNYPCPSGQFVWMIEGDDTEATPVTQHHFQYGTVGCPFACTLTSDGGSGTVASPYTYTIAWASINLQTTMTPQYGRQLAANMSAGRNGQATVNASGGFVLLQTDETYQTEGCTYTT